MTSTVQIYKGTFRKRCVLRDGPFGRCYQNIVYAVHAPGNRQFKIGKTNDIDKRFRSLRTMSPIELVLYGHLWMPDRTEYFIHDHLKEQRSHGEWFWDEGPVRKVAELIKAGDAVALAKEIDLAYLYGEIA